MLIETSFLRIFVDIPQLLPNFIAGDVKDAEFYEHYLQTIFILEELKTSSRHGAPGYGFDDIGRMGSLVRVELAGLELADVDDHVDLASAVTDGLLRIQVNQRYALSDTGQAHRDLEARKTTGSTVLLC